MAKSKTLTPQEIYRAKKQQEEQERLSFLPPGLVNHGNTCFMNSVLQGLIATRLLSNLVHFEPIPTKVQEHSNTLLASQRSPQLTNGHDLGGIYEQKWVDAMPIGDIFVGIMYRSWEAQRLRKRDNLSPRPLLTALGRKYDQYLDFAQQDAHEFLRILLDAMRMEEFDVIKKRQPPPPANKRNLRRRTTITPANRAFLNDEADSGEEDESKQLMSLSDMLFGGQLTSILVCQKCKHVSQTYEDFNDLSLSIKAEDYAKERKRDRLKKLARKMGMGGSGKRKPQQGPVIECTPESVISPPIAPEESRTSSSSSTRLNLDAQTPESSLNGVSGNHGVRASSVPPTPGINDQEQPFAPDGSRRRSLDGLTDGKTEAVSDEEEDSVLVEVVDASSDEGSQSKGLPPGLGPSPSSPDGKRIEFADTPKADRTSKSKEKDGWAKIGRRISMTVGIGKGISPTSKEKGKEKERSSRSRSRTSVDLGSSSREPSSPPLNPAVDNLRPEIRLSRPSLSPERPHSTPPLFKRALSSDIPSKPKPKSKARPVSLSPSPSQNALPTSDDASTTPKVPYIQRSKSPRPPKPSKAEEEYLRAILADVTATPASANPFDFFSNWHHHPAGENSHVSSSTSIPSAAVSSPSTSTASVSSGNAWLAKLGQLPLAGVEECLRMFTAVEILDGENMVGCRRCWKLANGWYEAREKRRAERNRRGKNLEDDGDDSEDDDGDEDDNDSDGRQDDEDGPSSASPDLDTPGHIRQTSSAPASPTASHDHLSSFSSPTLGLYAHQNASDIFSVVSSPPVVANDSNRKAYGASEDEPAPNSPEALRHLPSISTSDADKPQSDSPSMLTARPNGSGFDIPANDSAESNDSLLSVPSSTDTAAASSANYSSDGESDTTSISTATSAVVSGQSTDSLTDSATTPSGQSSTTSNGANGISVQISPSAPPAGIPKSRPQAPKKSKAPKPVIMRPAYKRYLVATPPPILVIHFKRFQQINKNPIISFSSGFKKLEDYVTFPEYFDLTPFLAPKKEDFGLGKHRKMSNGEKKRGKSEEKERCMYRLYAVVVHIGNMLGGHYISYTALPSGADMPQSGDNQALPPPPAGARQWAYISDTVVRLTTLEEVLKAKAYICMYERV